MEFTYHTPKIEYLNPVTPIERLVWFRWQRVEAMRRNYHGGYHKTHAEWESDLRAYNEAISCYNDTERRYGVKAFKVVSQYEISP